MVGSFGFQEIAMIAVAAIASLLLVGYPAARICRRLGLQPLLGMLAIVPVANVVLLFYVAFASWPAIAPDEHRGR